MSTLEKAAERILEGVTSSDARPYIIAIDGRCGSGKSTLGAYLEETYGFALIRMDDFYLREAQRSEERYAVPGENIDHERFEEEVLKPLTSGRDAMVRAYRFHEKRFLEPYEVKAQGIVVIEGSYAHHPSLAPYCDRKVFLDIDDENRHKRILERNGEEGLKNFIARWIPLEEKYFLGLEIEDKADIVIRNLGVEPET